jgi:hypothetical protein
MPEVVSGLFLEILILRQHSRGYLGATTNRMAHKYRTITLRCNMAILRRTELKELRAGRVDKLGRTNEPLASETGPGRERLDVRSDRGGVRSLVAVAAIQVDPAHLPLALQSSCTLVPKEFRSKVQLVHAESTYVRASLAWADEGVCPYASFTREVWGSTLSSIPMLHSWRAQPPPPAVRRGTVPWRCAPLR